MKKSLLLGSVLLVGIGAFAQSNRKALKPVFYKGTKAAKIDNFAGNSTNKSLKPTNDNVLVTSTGFSASRNGFGMLVEETVPLSYNADLNMVVFTQRIPPTTGTYAYPTAGITTPNSGHMITNASIDNGTTWSKASLFSASAGDVGGALARYPSAVIANAAGNTDAAQASFVGTGPCTDGSGWMANWFASRPANEVGNTVTNDQVAALTAIGSGSVAENTYFSSFCTTTRGTEVWTAGYQYAADGTTIDGVRIYKGVKTGAAYTWTSELNSQINDLFTSPDGSKYFSQPKIAWGADGLTGYIVINGVYASATGNAQKSYQPNVWKTMDGGANWAKVNDNYDWKTNHPYLTGNLLLSRYDSEWNGSLFGNDNYPAFFDSFGGEITVDNTGKLHYVTALSAGYSSHPDSLGYLFGQQGFSYVQNDNVDKPWVFDFSTDGSGSWSTEFITYLYTRNIADDEVVGTDAFWTTDGAGSLDYTNRIKVSRTNDGTKMFITWAESDTTVIETLGTAPNEYQAYQPNKTPSLMYKAKDIATGMWSPTMEAVYFDAVENAFYLHQTSEIVMPSACGYTIPTIYISSSDGSQNATNAIDYNYITDMEICNTNYTEPAGSSTIGVDPTFWIVGVKENKSELISGVSQNFPNPFNGTTAFNVNLKKSEVITVSVTNTIGQVVATKVVKGTAGNNEITLESANLESGIYFYSVVAGDAKVTRKMSIVK
jgi:hypothetical protein